MTGQLTRRGFLFFGGATLTGVTLGQFARRQIAWADARAAASRGQGVERWAVSVCRACPAACGIRVRIVDEQPVKLEGNPLCPVSRGRLCARGQAALESYADPDRLIGPARRVGPHGSGEWERLTWDEATDLLASRIRDVGQRPGAILAVAADEQGPCAGAWARTWRAAGARLTWVPSSTPTAARLRDRLASLTGVAAEPHFDLERASYVLSFGAPLVERWLSPVWAHRAYGRFRRGSGRQRGRLVQVDGRRSMTARKADEWIPTPADRQAMLAYGLIAVLLRENRVDRAALEPWAGNLEEFERAVVTRFTPNDVSAATGVPVVTILRLARDLIATDQPLVVLPPDAELDLANAALALNALIGAFDRPGGIVAALPAPYEPDAALRGGDAGADPPRLVALRDATAFRTLVTPEGLAGALGGADFIVSFSPYLDESAGVADLLMPVHTPLESWHAVVPAPGVPGQMMAFAEPAVRPRLDTGDLVQVLHAVAAAAGDPMAAACPWNSSREVVEHELEQLSVLRRGNPYATSYETEWMLQLERGGWWTSAVTSSEAFAPAVLEAGGWADPFFEPGRIRRTLRERGGFSFAAASVRAAGALDSRPGGQRYPLRLETFVPAAVSETGSPNQPVLFELLGQPEGAPWRAWVEVGTDTAHAAGVHTGDTVRVESAAGAVEASAVVVDGMREGVAMLAFVPGVPAGGRWARAVGQDARSLGTEEALRSGAVQVRIRKA